MPEATEQVHYVDETTTGDTADPRLRDFAKVMLSARAPPTDDLTWVRDAIALAPEIAGRQKSTSVIVRCLADPPYREWVMRRIRNYSIALVDFFEDQQALLRSLSAATRVDFTDRRFLARMADHREAEIRSLAEQLLLFLRGSLLETGAIGEAKLLFERLRYVGGDLIDEAPLLRANDKVFRETVSRLTVYLGEVLNPERMADWWLEEAQFRRYVPPDSYVSLEAFSRGVGDNFLFDVGAAFSVDAVKRAQDRIIEEVCRHPGYELLERGRIDAQASKDFLGLQAADIAVGIARHILTDGFGSVSKGAERLCNYFTHVLLNGTRVSTGNP